MEGARERVAILLNSVWHSAVIDFGFVILESSGLNSSFQELKLLWWWSMAPMKEMVKKWIGFGMTWTRFCIA